MEPRIEWKNNMQTEVASHLYGFAVEGL